MASKKGSFEAVLTRLEALVEKLDQEDLGLEEAMAIYQEGVSLAKEGHSRLQAAERKIEELSDRSETKPFEPGDLGDTAE
jgi:exodeoxyribonuclease VII small subunit